jgi:hypothetical protein
MKFGNVAPAVIVSALFNLKYFIKCDVGVCGGRQSYES